MSQHVRIVGPKSIGWFAKKYEEKVARVVYTKWEGRELTNWGIFFSCLNAWGWVSLFLEGERGDEYIFLRLWGHFFLGGRGGLTFYKAPIKVLGGLGNALNSTIYIQTTGEHPNL